MQLPTLMLLLAALATAACGGAHTPATPPAQDSSLMFYAPTAPTPPAPEVDTTADAATRARVLGTWKLVRTQVEDIELGEDILGNVTLTLNADGTKVSKTPDIKPLKTQYSFRGGVILDNAESLRVISVTAQELVLETKTTEGITSICTYKRLP